jgi:acyl-coenzyme A thioesterase PaaI-like protein/rubrerythrin
MINHKSIIDESVLFFANPQFKEFIPDSKYEEILNIELWEWLSASYWGETLGIEYALKMSELSENTQEKEVWLETYREEIDHQQRLGNWFTNNKTYPLPPTLMMRKARTLIEKGRSARNFLEYQNVIRDGQIFFEETGVCLIKWRCGHIKDRPLRAILYKIIKDEASHISNGKKKLVELESSTKTRTENMSDNLGKLFPLHIAKKHLKDDNYRSIKSVFKKVFADQLNDILQPKIYKPITTIAKFENIEGYECFGCKPTRSEGLLLEPQLAEGAVSDQVIFSDYFCGMNGLVHGGFISMALDEMMGYTITLGLEKLSLTTNLNIEFIRPVKCNEKYIIEARILSTDDKKTTTYAEIRELSSGRISAKGKADFFILNKDVCRKIFPSIYNDPKLSHLYT